MSSLFNAKRYTSLESDNVLGKHFKNLGKAVLSLDGFCTLNTIRKNRAIDLSLPENTDKWKELIDFTTADSGMLKRVKIALILACVFVAAFLAWFFLFFLEYNIILRVFLFISVTALCFYLVKHDIVYYTPLTTESLGKSKELFSEPLPDEPAKKN